MKKPPAAAAGFEVRDTRGIEARTWDEIWQLTRLFYETERGYSEASLKKRPQTVLVRSKADGRLVGMVSMEVFMLDFQGCALAVIYTSHVLLLEAYRGLNLIQKIGFGEYLKARARHPLRSVIWFFDTFSYKSYLLLPRNFRHFWPRYERPTPAWETALMDHLSVRVYGESWRPEQGIVLRSGRKRLKAATAPLDPSLATLPELDFFARANPGHAEGDMLVCLCPLTLTNWFSAGLKAAQRLRR